ncbi:S8 family serine peptidase [Pendulispora rubella]|uniref:S8 family serine peptidase n=1 Tax=Pendulispora rubella TaxID=2741070 RepID=A0ABZ2KVJ1_9BACT
MAACSDSAPAVVGSGDDAVETRVAQAGLTALGWGKLDATLRSRTLDDAPASEASAPSVALYVQSKEPEVTRRLIEAAGGSVGTVSGDVMTARVPAGAVATIANNVSVSRMEGATPVYARLDKTIAAVKADQVHAGAAPLPSAFKGAGVIVGVVDGGMDLKHAAFKTSDGKTRIRSLWHQTAKGGKPPSTYGYDYGSVCDAAAIDAGTCNYTSKEHHGTHVTGIAAGSRVAGVPYLGMAPESDLVLVDVDLANQNSPDAVPVSTAICDGAGYIFKMAEAANKPAVVNMSLGDFSGPHDGSSLADKCLDNLTGPGKIIVAAAGNEGRAKINPLASTRTFAHATAVASTKPVVVRWLPGRVMESNGQFYADQILNLWSNSDVNLSVRVGFVPVAGGTPTYSKAIQVDKPLARATLTDGTITVGPVQGAGSVEASGARNIRVGTWDGDGDHREDGLVWLLEITGNGRFDAWIDSTRGGGFIIDGQEPGVSVNHDMTIGFPATASKVISVASYTSRNSWTAAKDGQEWKPTGADGKPLTIGAISEFSSRGPLRNEAAPMKPDITAPGEMVISAWNTSAPIDTGTPDRIVKAPPNGYAAYEGTSMASPVVAGVVALMLQKEPKLTVEDIRGTFQRTAVKPDGVTVPSSTWGYGKLDAFAAVGDAKVAPPPPNDGNGDAKGEEKSKSGCNVAPTGGLFSGLGAGALALSMMLVRRRRRG